MPTPCSSDQPLTHVHRPLHTLPRSLLKTYPATVICCYFSVTIFGMTKEKLWKTTPMPTSLQQLNGLKQLAIPCIYLAISGGVCGCVSFGKKSKCNFTFLSHKVHIKIPLVWWLSRRSSVRCSFASLTSGSRWFVVVAYSCLLALFYFR